MKEGRKQEIIGRVQGIIDSFVETENEPELNMFGLISQYNSQHENAELIGGQWIRKNIPELANLP